MSTKAGSVSKKAAPKKQPVVTMPQAKPEPCASPNFSNFATEWREKVNKTLTDYFETFLKEGFAEEKAFMSEAFLIWEGQSIKEVRGFMDHEMPFLTALSETLNGEYLVKVDSRAMVGEVEEFITKKIESGWKAPKRGSDLRPWNDPKDTQMERVRKLLLRHVDYVSYNCRQEDMAFLVDMLEQWETIVASDELSSGTKHHMAAAAEIHLDVMKKREEWFRKYEAEKAANA